MADTTIKPFTAIPICPRCKGPRFGTECTECGEKIVLADVVLMQDLPSYMPDAENLQQIIRQAEGFQKLSTAVTGGQANILDNGFRHSLAGIISEYSSGGPEGG